MKIVVTAIMIMMNIGLTNGQTLKSYGLKAGFSFAMQKYEPTVLSGNVKQVTGIDFALNCEWFNIPYVSILTELHYIQKGRIESLWATEKADNQLGYVDLGFKDFKFRYNYLSVPVLLKMRYSTSLATPYIIIGPRLDYLLSSSPREVNEKSDVGYSLGIGLSTKLISFPEFSLEYRYSPGFQKIKESELNSLRLTNYSMEVLLGINF